MKKREVFLKSLLVFLFLIGSAAYAGDSSTGCGLGWQVAPKQSLVSATTRTITNATFSNQIFGTTSGTSGCAKHSIVENYKESLNYAMINGQKLMLEMAQGNGEVLRTYASTFDCNDAIKVDFNNSLQANYNEVISHQQVTPFEIVENTVKVLKSNPTISKNCRLLAM